MDFKFLDHIATGKSFLVSGSFMESDARPVELFLFAVFIIVGSWALSAFFGAGIVYLFDRMGQRSKLRAKIDRRMPFVTGLQKRYETLQEQIKAVNETAQEQVAFRNDLKVKIKKVLGAKDQLVRQIGENLNNSNCYAFLVVNRYVIAYASKGQRHPLLDDSWKNGQLVEVWTQTLLEARLLIAERYPATQGYAVEAASPSGNGKTGAASDRA